MNEKQNLQLKKIKVSTILIVVFQAMLFFLPTNFLHSDMTSFYQLWQKLVITLEWNDNMKLFLIVVLSTFALAINVLSTIFLFFIKTPKRYRNVALPTFLCSAVVYAFCWGSMIDIEKLVVTLFGFDFIALVLSVIIITMTLFIDETQVVKKEM